MNLIVCAYTTQNNRYGHTYLLQSTEKMLSYEAIISRKADDFRFVGHINYQGVCVELSFDFSMLGITVTNWDNTRSFYISCYKIDQASISKYQEKTHTK